MQKKVLTGILVLAVILVWGYVGYRFFAGIEQQEDVYAENSIAEESLQPINIDTKGSLHLNYPDPFLKTDHKPIMTKSIPVQPKKVEKKKEVLPPPSTFNWPTIAYKGLIQNQNHPEKLLGLVIINGRERIIRKGEKLEELTVITIDKTKVELQFEKEKRTFSK